MRPGAPEEHIPAAPAVVARIAVAHNWAGHCRSDRSQVARCPSFQDVGSLALGGDSPAPGMEQEH